jgi:uncharacterized protein (DUF2267 family)
LDQLDWGADLMDDRAFYLNVSRRTMLSKEESADLSRAVVETIAQRLSAGELRELAGQLPSQLAEVTQRDSKSPVRFGLDEAIRRVSKRTGLTEVETTDGIRAVLTTLRDPVDEREFTHLMSNLPAEFSRLVDAEP